MTEKYDAVIIGAGIIGCCISFELTKLGYKTINVDKLAGAGMGPTGASCAIIRLHYSTPQGVAMAREGYYYWLDWTKYLETRDPQGMAFYRNTGALVVKTPHNKYLKRVTEALDEIGVGYVIVAPNEISHYLPDADLRSYYPQKWILDDAFGEPTGDTISGAIWVPESGYISDPQLSTHNVQVAAEAKGASFLYNQTVTDIIKNSGRAAGVNLSDGTEISAKVVAKSHFEWFGYPS